VIQNRPQGLNKNWLFIHFFGLLKAFWYFSRRLNTPNCTYFGQYDKFSVNVDICLVLSSVVMPGMNYLSGVFSVRVEGKAYDSDVDC